ncbi:inositol monophosphatase family protein [Lederbergia citrea]|uniref:inositol-phosphate phosphatase n=1 Tax=Lederbergia citrea TaxID=2833581 RepID=A0A942Z3G2_9BACI|nr:inositol monophosphatase family protein [Lederbergia citrea]MBS4177265.1 inositol monophosphatase family protein [Lederbergia citrea]MBS4203928.1 inositol monophosphatase family protein [Lederbergia citrea]MBS4221487.1 inositol monophosphatase family protein [Lederbergia citrea]
MTCWASVDEHAKLWLKEAGKKIIASFQTALEINTKADANDLVTNIDQQIEQYFTKEIRLTFPSHKILGEEGFGDELVNTDGVIWIIDPIDGTMNFVHQQRNFFISIGILDNGIGKLGYLYDVVHDELYYAEAGKGAYWDELKLPKLEEVPVENALIGCSATWMAPNRYMDPTNTLIPLAQDVRGTRSYGSAALEFAYVATGRLDAYISMRLSPWDFAGGKIIVEELGGIVTDLNGEKLSILQKSSILVAKPGLHAKILENYLKK